MTPISSRRNMKKILILLALLLTLPLQAQQKLSATLDQLLRDPMFETSHVGLMVYDLTADRPLYAHGHRQLLRPASTMKLLTAVTALRHLGGNHPVQTRFRYAGAVADSTFTGNIYCIGGFDPAFGTDELAILADSLRARGIRNIRGNIITDRSMTDNQPLGEGWSWDDSNPILTPLLCNRGDLLAEELVGHLVGQGFNIQVNITDGTCPEQTASLCTVSHSLDQILLPMMKQSDNLYAESVLFQIASATGTAHATVQQARETEEQFIADLGLRPEDYRIADGSGLSLYNYLSAELLVQVLRYAWQHPDIYDHLAPTLPVAGIDGTLKNRMKNTPAKGKVRAKTGTVTGVSSLAGYAQAANQHILAFAIINQGLRNGRDGRDFQDRVCTALCR